MISTVIIGYTPRLKGLQCGSVDLFLSEAGKHVYKTTQTL